MGDCGDCEIGEDILMAWFSIKGKTLGDESLDQFLGLITAVDYSHAMRKSKKLFPRRKITEVQEVQVLIREIRERSRHAKSE